MSWTYRADWDNVKDGTVEVTNVHFEDIRRLCFAIMQVSRNQDLHGYYVETWENSITENDTYDNEELYGGGSIVIYRNRPYLLRQGWSQGKRPPEGSWILIARSNVYTDYDYNSGCRSYMTTDGSYYNTFPAWYNLPPQVDRFKRRTGTVSHGTKVGYQRFIQWLSAAGSPLAGKKNLWTDALADSEIKLAGVISEYDKLITERALIVKLGKDTTVVDNLIAKNREEYDRLSNLVIHYTELLKSVEPEHVGNDLPVEFAIKEQDAFQDAGGGGRNAMDMVSGALGAQYAEYSNAHENLIAQEIPVGRSVYPYTKAHKQPYLQSDNGFDWKIQAYQSYIESFVDARGDFMWPSPEWTDGDNDFHFRRLDDRDENSDGDKVLPQIWNCNFSAFEKCLELVGEYDWYLDVAFPPDPTMEKLATYGEEYRIKGVWRRTWKYSIGYPRCPYDWVFDPKTERPLIYPGEKGTPPYQYLPANPARGGMDTFWTIKDNVVKAWLEAFASLTDYNRLVTNRRHDFTSLDKEQPYYKDRIQRAQGHEDGTYINYEPKLGHILWTCKEVLEKLVYMPLGVGTLGYKQISGGSGVNPETGNTWDVDGLSEPSSAGGALSAALANFNIDWDNRLSAGEAPWDDRYHKVGSTWNEDYNHLVDLGYDADPPPEPIAFASVKATVPYLLLYSVSENIKQIMNDVCDYAVVPFESSIPDETVSSYSNNTESDVTAFGFVDAVNKHNREWMRPIIPASFAGSEYTLQRPKAGTSYTTKVTYARMPFYSLFGDNLYLFADHLAGGTGYFVGSQRKAHQFIEYDDGSGTIIKRWTGTAIQWQESISAYVKISAISNLAHVKINVQKINLNEGLL